MTVILLSRSPPTFPEDGEPTESPRHNDSPHLTIQMLPTTVSKGLRPVFAAIPIISQVDKGPMKNDTDWRHGAWLTYHVCVPNHRQANW